MGVGVDDKRRSYSQLTSPNLVDDRPEAATTSSVGSAKDISPSPSSTGLA